MNWFDSPSCGAEDLLDRRLANWQGTPSARASRVCVLAKTPRVSASVVRICRAHRSCFALIHPETPAASFRTIAAELGPTHILAEGGVDGPVGDLLAAVSSMDPSRVPGTPVRIAPDHQLLETGWDRVSNDPLLDGAAAVIYTSGSSGKRRGVVVSHENMEFAASAIQARLNYRRDDVIGVFVPLSFDYGLYQVILAERVGANLYFGEQRFIGPDLAARLVEASVTVLPAVPTLILALLKVLRRKKVSLPRLRVITSTGDHLPPAWVNELQSYLPHVEIYSMYGLTECKRVSILTPSERSSHPDSVGRPLDGTEVHAVDSTGNPLCAGELGELVVLGPHVARGYLAAPRDTAERFRVWGHRGRALFTGDLGWVDSEGFVYVQGRVDSLIKRKGMRMSKLELEQAAAHVPGVEAAVAVHDQSRDKLTLVVCGEAEALREAVVQHLGNVLERFKLPDVIEFVDELPRTANGKLDRAKLSDHFMSRQ